jgi:hypothetical protein
MLARRAAAAEAPAEPAPEPAPDPAFAPPRAATSAAAINAAGNDGATPGKPADPVQAAREARRRGVAAAIARGEEPQGDYRSIETALPQATRAAAGLRAQRLRILRADVPASLPRETPKAAFMARVRAASKGLSGLGVSARCVEAAAEAYLVLERKQGGFAWGGFNSLATIAGYCARHIQRAMRWLEGAGLLDVLNTPYREGDEWWRDANIYVATMDAEPAPLPADVAGKDPVLPAATSRALGGAARLAALFGLVLRAGGLNTSPARDYRARGSPA